MSNDLDFFFNSFVLKVDTIQRDPESGSGKHYTRYSYLAPQCCEERVEQEWERVPQDTVSL